MADKKIGELPAAAGLYPDTLFAVEQQGTAAKLTGHQIIQAVGGGGEGGEYIPVPGPQGPPGEDGATFTPSVSPDGLLSWTNNKGLPNPEPVDIKGPPGDSSGAGGGGDTPADMVTADGGGEILMPESLGSGPYEIEFTEDDGSGGSDGGGSDTDLSNYALLENPKFSKNIAVGYAAYGVGPAASFGSSENSAVVGYSNKINSNNSITSGMYNENYSTSSLIAGENNNAGNAMASCIGFKNVSNGNYSLATGVGTIAGYLELTAGKYNVESPGSTLYGGNMFIIGIGSDEDNRANGFRVSKLGSVYGVGAYNSSGADYAEIYEWADGNPEAEDRAGRFVVLDGENIRFASPEDNILDILGIVSAAPSVVGDVHDDQWRGMYLRDVFGRLIYEDVEVDDPSTPGQTITERVPKLNPAYDHTRPYIPQSQRPEKSAVGLLGKLVAVDDGTCEVNGWCAPGAGGIAVKSETRTRFRVMSRLDETHIRVNIMLQ